MALGNLLLFAPNDYQAMGECIARHLGVSLSAHEERDFDDGEHKCRPLVSVRGADVYVVQSFFRDHRYSVNDKLCRFLFFVGALRDASAHRITAVVPYLCYARKDRKTKSRDPVTTRYVAQLLEAVGVDRVVTLDVHNLQAFQNAYRCPTDHLEARKLLVAHAASRLGNEDCTVLSPDAGGVYRAEKFRASLSQAIGHPLPLAFMEKHRSAGVVRGEAIVGEVRDRSVIIVDDLISTGGTLVRAATACLNLGARQVYAYATHGVFTSDTAQTLSDPALARVVITNSVPPTDALISPELKATLVILDLSPLLAEVIRRLHTHESLTELMEDDSPQS